MSTIVDHQICQLVTDFGMIEPYNPFQQNPASYDVLLGDKILIEDPEAEPYYETDETQRWCEFDISKNPYFLRPGEFILAHTLEYVRIPRNIEAVFCLKSSRGREGWNHALAGYIDPKFHGRITLELKNYNQYQSLKAKAGMRIGQLRFSKLNAIPAVPYDQTGRYCGDEGVQVSRG